MPSLRILRGPDIGQEFQIDGDRTVMGRHPECDIVLDVGAVSRQHAHIVAEAGKYFVEDLHSRNGTFVNGQPIEQRQELSSGDEVAICDLAFGFFDDTPPPPMAFNTLDGSSVSFMGFDEEQHSNSTIMSKLDLSSDSAHMLMQANPQVKLQAFLEITKSLSKALSIEDVLPNVLDSLFKIFLQADRGFIVLQDHKDSPLIPKAVKFRRPDQEDSIRLSRTVIETVLEEKEAILSADATRDDRFQMSQSIADFHIRSMMCAPLMNSEGESLGIIQIDTLDQRSRFSEHDLEVLAGVATQAGIAIQNAQLHEEALKRQAVDLDLRLAHRVQQGLLPSAPPTIKGYTFFDFYEAANQVGGDYYDYIDVPNGRTGVVLADVSGKGVAAALLMARLSSDVRYCMATDDDLGDAISQLNNTFIRSGWDDRFVTLLAMILDPEKNLATVVNAGHMPPVVRHADLSIEEIGEEATGLPLGVVPDYAYQSFEFSMNEGDAIAMFTDGFSEAMNAEGELYGLERLRQRMAAKVPNFSELGSSILGDVRNFVGGTAQSDDMCLVCLGREK